MIFLLSIEYTFVFQQANRNNVQDHVFLAFVICRWFPPFVCLFDTIEFRYPELPEFTMGWGFNVFLFWSKGTFFHTEVMSLYLA